MFEQSSQMVGIFKIINNTETIVYLPHQTKKRKKINYQHTHSLLNEMSPPPLGRIASEMSHKSPLDLIRRSSSTSRKEGQRPIIKIANSEKIIEKRLFDSDEEDNKMEDRQQRMKK